MKTSLALAGLSAIFNYILTISIVKDGEDITNSFLKCEGTICTMAEATIQFNTELKIVSDDPCDPPPTYQTLRLENSKMFVSSNVQGSLSINLNCMNLEIQGCGIISKWIDIKLKNYMKSILTSFTFERMSLISDDSMLLNGTILSRSNNYCDTEIMTGILNDGIFRNNYAELNCDPLSSVYDNNIDWLLGFISSDDYREMEATLIIASKTVSLVHNAEITGNILLITDKLEITNNSELKSLASGCEFNGAPGTPILFISQSFSCGLNGGSYGGRGGIGINIDKTEQSISCLKTSFSKMSEYGDPFMPTGSGSTGSAFEPGSGGGGYIAPGTMLIYTKVLTLDDSRIHSGYSLDNKRTGHPANSGGSIYLIFQEMNLGVNAEIWANGQSSDNLESGAGSGGRIFFHNYCWDKDYQKKEKPTYNFQETQILAKSGKRGDLAPFLVSPYLEIVRAEKGSIRGTPCALGHTGINCKKCPEGEVRLDLTVFQCQKCDMLGKENAIYSRDNTCSEYKCNQDLIQLSKNINPFCLQTIDLFSQKFISRRFILMTGLLITISIHLLMIICTLGKKSKKKEEKSIIEEIQNDLMFISLQGKNMAQNPWFLDLDTSRDFNSFIKKRDYFTLTREINRITKWSSRSAFIYKSAKILCPYFENYILKKYRKKIFKKLDLYIKKKNLEWRDEKNFEMSLWVSEDFAVGQIIIKDKYTASKSLSPFSYMIRGEGTIDDPFRIQINTVATKAYLQKLVRLRVFSKSTLTNDYNLFRMTIKVLNNHLSLLNIYDDSLMFVHSMMVILDEIERINMDYLIKYELKCSLFIVEDLKLQHQRKNLRYNNLLKIEARSIEKLYVLKKLFEFYRETNKLSAQIVLFFMPMRNKEILEEVVTKKLTQKKKKSKNIAQRIFVTDLTKDTKAWEKFLKIECKKKFSVGLFRANVSLTRLLRTPTIIKLTTSWRLILKIVLLLFFCIDFSLMYILLSITFFHVYSLMKLLFLMMFIFPYFLSPLYGLISQIVYIFTTKNKDLLFVSNINLKIILNFGIWSSVLFIFFIVGWVDRFVFAIWPIYMVLKMLENYIICVIEGDKRLMMTRTHL